MIVALLRQSCDSFEGMAISLTFPHDEARCGPVASGSWWSLA